MIVNCSFGFNQGNLLRLTYGEDYKVNVCADKHSDPNLSKLELKYWQILIRRKFDPRAKATTYFGNRSGTKGFLFTLRILQMMRFL
ncbi:hypothetical protein PIB30_075435 [Stylosanthes scabra]|uniref:Uncharacterized protein n=1 Tax=Stylosanthes scabra TaxID=79078 RepID=A0ABU6RQQ3_9FABA|nr:hypothetical protein [Stylosanthes scabra]